MCFDVGIDRLIFRGGLDDKFFFCKKLEKNSYSRWGMCWYIFITIEIGNLFNGVLKIMTWVLICIVRELLLIIF
jgi:hypothetical protein